MKEGVLAEAVLVPVPMHQNRKAACMTGEEVEGVGEAVCTREVCMWEEVLAESRTVAPVPIHHNVKSQKAQNPRIYLAYLQYKNIFT